MRHGQCVEFFSDGVEFCLPEPGLDEPAVPPQDDAKLKQPAAAAAGKTPPLVFISMLLPALPIWLGLFVTSLYVGVLRWE